MDLEGIMPSEISHTEKEILYIPYTQDLKNKAVNITTTRKKKTTQIEKTN